MQPCPVDLLAPETFSHNVFHQSFEQMRRERTLHRHEEPGGPGFWVASRYQDAQAIYTDPQSFSSRSGISLGSSPAAVAGVADRQLVVSDPPRHTRVRRISNEAFTPRRLRRLVEPVALAVDELISRFREAGSDFVAEVAEPLPVHVICAMMELPRPDWDDIARWTTKGLESPDPVQRVAANAEIMLYLTELVELRRAEPGDDLVSILMAMPANGQEPLTDEEIVINCNGILVGAIETLRYTAAGGVLALALNPGAWSRVRDGSAGTDATAEEILRWTAPGVHAMRTVLRPVEIAGVELEPGERITLWNCSANRDEEVFTEAGRFVPERTPNHHLTFGWGPHTCIGSRLARIELGALLSSLRAQVTGLELTGEVAWSSSNFIHGVTRLPIRLA